MFILLILLCVACDSIDVPFDFSEIEGASSEDEVSEKEPLSVERWETTTVSEGKTVVRKFTKEYNGNKNNYTTTTEVYVDSVFIEKSIIVFSDGYQSYKEKHQYQNSELFFSEKIGYYDDGTIKSEEIYTADSKYTLNEKYFYDTDGIMLSGIVKKEYSTGMVNIGELYRTVFENQDCIVKTTSVYNANNKLEYEYVFLKSVKSKTLEQIEYYDSNSELKYFIKNSGEEIKIDIEGIGGFVHNQVENMYTFFDKALCGFAKAELNGNEFVIVATDKKYEASTAENMVLDIWNTHVFYRDIIIDEIYIFFDSPNDYVLL